MFWSFGRPGPSDDKGWSRPELGGMKVGPEVLAYKSGRLRISGCVGCGRLEFWPTQDVLRRVCRRGPGLDVGGGSGGAAQWLAQDGIGRADQAPCRHVAAAAPGVSARLGDA